MEENILNQFNQSWNHTVKENQTMISCCCKSEQESKSENMSLLIGFKCNNGIVIAADSRETISNVDGTIQHNDNFQKVFENEKRIWGVIGFNGYKLELYNQVNDYIRGADKVKEEALTEIIDSYCQTHNYKNKFVNLFIGEKMDGYPVLFIYDYDESLKHKSRMLIIYDEGKFSAGANSYMNIIDSLGNYGNNFEQMKTDAIKVVEFAIKVDKDIHSTFKNYKQTIGGHAETVCLK